MSTHPLNLTLRFLLELTALGALGAWGWSTTGGLARWAVALAVPLAFAVVWGVFNVPGDPSRSGGAVVVVPGSVRLLIELAVFGAAVAALQITGRSTPAVVFGGIVALHYLASWDRIRWLLQQ